jgi:ribose transport system substrate-binding protein
VVAYGAEPSLPTPASFTVATDVRRAAAEACEALVNIMGGNGRILNVLESPTDPNTQLRNQGIEGVAAKYPNVSITQALSGMTEFYAAKEKIQNTLAARSQVIDGMIATGGQATRAAAAVLSEWHANPDHKRIRFIGIDTDPAVMEAIEKGAIDATLAQNHFGQGYISSLLLARMLEGWTPYRPYVFIDAGHIVVNKNNITTFQEELWGFAEGTVADFEKRYLRPPR